MSEKLLEVKHLSTSFFTHVGEVKAIRDISFSIDRGEFVGIVGESGSGKSVTSLSIMQLLQYPGRVTGGEILFNGEDLLKKDKKEMRKVRGNQISMCFQDPMTALNPLYTIGNQINEVILEHQKLTKKEATEKTIEMLGMVGIPDPAARVNSYPHEFSGGMRQRAMIAMALACQPELLIADEPTTALDVTIQAQVLRLLKELQERTGTSIILITHDLGVVASSCSRILVMYGGQIMETGRVEDIFYTPRHPYTMGLLKSIPKAGETDQRLESIPGTPPDMLSPPKGCPFYPRCEFAMQICKENPAPEFEIGEGHCVKCWLCHPEAPQPEKYQQQKGGIRNG
ncbi:ABC transporter ATP-binding protein [Pseudoflavonifractor phocaeensis]|uniref:ABC transporter ATP-binding protein n=1 Tax=Pseudoflavonifractor phocaeensis TaxID=1870988 RepID=UPI001F35703B|nr:ABC transporter ATP-binding protein [Pseudoflavonifractor phocaeensis]MCF2596944.1 ABC transporter ATP-binding protein [Pseudoflavonifractor phocaeensis]